MRDAESTLDQLISFCGDKIEEPDVLSMFGLTAQGQLLELARSVLAGEVEKALRQLNNLANNGKDLGRLLSDLLNHFRNLLIFQVSRGDLSMIEVSEAESGSLSEQSKMAGTEGLTRIMEVLGEAEMRLRDAASKKILVEVTLLKAIEARNAMSIDAVLKQLHNLREGQGIEAAPGVAQPVPAARPVAKPLRAEAGASLPIPAEPAFAIAPQSSASAIVENGQEEVAIQSQELADLQGLWAKLIEAVGRASPFTRTYLVEAHPVSFSKGVFTIGFDPEFEDHMGLVDSPRNHTLLQTKLQELGHSNAQIKFVKAEAPAPRAVPSSENTPPASPPAPKAPVTIATARAAAPRPAPVQAKEKLASVPFNKDDFKNDPLIAKALEIFKGQIVEVRS